MHGLIKALAWGLAFAVVSSTSPAVRADAQKAAASSGVQARTYAPVIAPASEQAKQAMRSFRVPGGLKVELFAAEPLLANPVAFCIDEKGAVYVAETFRHSAGVPDTRGHMDWLDEDLASRTVADRVAMYRKYLGKGFAAYEVEHERVRRVVDRDRDGQADTATVFADEFNDPAAGIGAGVLARKGDVWYACIPWLWKLRDTDADGRADRRILLHQGYGVHVGFIGHDLHGLRFGPDGKLYFSIGDRGFNVTTIDGRRLAVPDTGSVLRCNPDGSELEVFATGLRNPQELAFDAFGNLFTGDNNSDSGDRARWVYLVEGGDSGWRIGYQFITEPVSRGPWNEERLWYPAFDGQAAYIVPPIAHIADGPSGLAYDPGVSLLPTSSRNHFFLADFRGSSRESGIRSFTLRPKGASFELVDSQRFVWSVLATDVDFGPDGALTFSDWVEGWEKPNKGRLYRVLDPSRRNDPQVREVQMLLAEGMENRPADSLAKLLAHPDMRVRQEAQFALVAQGEEGSRAFAQVAGSKGALLARIHAIWGLGQLARAKAKIGGHSPSLWQVLGPLLDDPEAEIRAQAARVLGDTREVKAWDRLVGLLGEASPRVRFFAAMALGKLGRVEGIGPLVELLRANADQDPYLRHAGVMGLVGSVASDWAAIQRAARDESPAVRMGLLLALRRHGDPGVAQFLKDSDPRLVLEAARAINDESIVSARPALAALPITSSMPLPLARRVLNANFQSGGSQHAAALAETVVRSDLPLALRVQALGMLGDWARPPGRDAIMGLWRPIPERSAQPAADALRPRLGAILSASSEAVRNAAALAAARLGIKEAAAPLAAMVTDSSQTDRTRAAALEALDQLEDPRRIDAARRAAALPGARTRIAALHVLAKADPDAAIAMVQDRLEHGSTLERQGAIAVLASIRGAAACQTLVRWLNLLSTGKVPPEIQLDLVEAAGARPEAEARQKLQQYEASKPKDDPLSLYREVLSGGNAQRGRSVFTDKAEVACLRCHKARTWAGEIPGGEVGPELSGIGARQNRTYLLESIVDPNHQIAQGFDSIVLATHDGQIITGVLRSEDDKDVRLVTAEGQPLTVPKDTIEDRRRGVSAMPADLVQKLSKTELRDLIEFLASLKTPLRTTP
jgi:quinoprotein glucose dehydrogenase